MTTYSCDTNPDEEEREEEPTQLAQTFMVGKWTFHSYRKSHDGKTLIYHLVDGIKVQQGDKVVEYKLHLRHHNPRGFFFAPDNASVAFWAPFEEGQPHKRVAVMDLGGLSSSPKFKVVYTPPEGHNPFGLEWAPDGKAIFVVEKTVKDDVDYAILKRIDMPSGGKGKELYRTAGKIDFFMPPVSRFENGDGSSTSKYFIVYGHPTGLFLTDPQGKRIRRVSKLPAIGLHNIEWNPAKGKNQLVLYFKKGATSPTGEKFKGVYLIHLARINREKEKGPAIEQLYDRTDVHTLWYSPRGKYVCWATVDAIFYRRPLDKPDKTVKLIAIHDDLELEVKGMAWRGDGAKLAFTAGNHLFAHDVAQPKAPPTLLATFGKDTTHFTAEPIWVGNDVFLTVFEDMTHRVKPEKTGGGTQITVEQKKKR
jgi:hypothetical protein